MKKIFLIIGIINYLNSFSQVITDPDLDKFIGTWQWTSGNDTVTIILQKQVINFFRTGNSREGLVGWHRYVKNGIQKESSFQFTGLDYNTDINSTDPDFKVTLHGFSRNPMKIFFTTFWDLTLHKSCSLYFTLLPNSATQATWKLTDHQGIYNGPSGTCNKFTLPQDLILTKQ